MRLISIGNLDAPYLWLPFVPPWFPRYRPEVTLRTLPRKDLAPPTIRTRSFPQSRQPPERSLMPWCLAGQPSTYCNMVDICTELSNIITFLLSTALWYIYSNYIMFWACAQISSFRTIGYRSRGPVFESLSRHNSVCIHDSTVIGQFVNMILPKICLTRTTQ